MSSGVHRLDLAQCCTLQVIPSPANMEGRLTTPPPPLRLVCTTKKTQLDRCGPGYHQLGRVWACPNLVYGHPKKNIHKCVHDWLPIGEVMDRRYKTQTACPKYPQHDTRYHMRECPANSTEVQQYYIRLEKQLKPGKRDLTLPHCGYTV